MDAKLSCSPLLSVSIRQTFRGIICIKASWEHEWLIVYWHKETVESRSQMILVFPKQKYYTWKSYSFCYRKVCICKEKQIVSFESRKESFCKEKGLLTSLISTIVDIHKGNCAVQCTHSISCLAGKTWHLSCKKHEVNKGNKESLRLSLRD